MTEEIDRKSVEQIYEKLERYRNELNGVSDRTAAILAAAYFDDILSGVIINSFPG